MQSTGPSSPGQSLPLVACAVACSASPIPLAAERLYAKTVAVDPVRAHTDVYYVDQRLLFLVVVTDDDPEVLIHGAPQASVRAFVAAGRPAEQCLDEVEHAYAPLREATADEHPTGTTTGLLAAYLDAWRHAVS